MNNELGLTRNEITSDLKIKNFDELKAKYDKVAEQYNDYQVTFDNEQEAKQIVRNIHKNNREVNDLRKQLSKSYRAKIKDLKAHTDELTYNLDNEASKIDKQVKDIEKQFTEKRKEIVTKVVNKMCDERNMEHIELDPKWYSKSNCKRNGEPNRACLQLIDSSLQLELANQNNREINEARIRTRCLELGMNSDGYLDELNAGARNTDDILKDIDKRYREYQKENQDTKQVNDKYINKNTGEIKDARKSVDVQLTGEAKKIATLKSVAKRLNIEWKEA